MQSEIKFPIQMYDPTRDYLKNKKEFDITINNIINAGNFINGPQVTQLEGILEQYTSAKYCITCANGTDALFISLLALNIGNGDEVITVAHTWISTAETIAMTGAKPVFVDISAVNFNIDTSKIVERITKNTKAILFVSLYGLMPDLEQIKDIADKYNLYVIEDGAQSFGAKYKESRSCSCYYTNIATSSFFPSKPLGCWGDGGAMFTNDDQLAIKLRSIKSHGGVERFKHKYIGVNSRLDTLQAGILLVKMKHFDQYLITRNRCADYYSEKLAHLNQVNQINQLTLPMYNRQEYNHSWAQYSILAENLLVRNSIVEHLKNNKINVSIFYPIGLHRQECFEYLNVDESKLEVTNNVCDRVFNLPCYAEITIEEQDYIINIVCDFFNK